MKNQVYPSSKRTCPLASSSLCHGMQPLIRLYLEPGKQPAPFRTPRERRRCNTNIVITYRNVVKHMYIWHYVCNFLFLMSIDSITYHNMKNVFYHQMFKTTKEYCIYIYMYVYDVYVMKTTLLTTKHRDLHRDAKEDWKPTRPDGLICKYGRKNSLKDLKSVLRIV